MSDTNHPAKRKKMEIPQQTSEKIAEKMAYWLDGKTSLSQPLVALVVAALVEVISGIDEVWGQSVLTLTIVQATDLVAKLGKEDQDNLLAAINTADWATALSYVPRKDKLAPPSPLRAIVLPRDDSVRASRLAWRTPYQGKTQELLLKYINALNRARKGEYQNFASIIQSSGCGKSRAVDEVARKVFTLPFNLRDPSDDTGYPESDKKAAEFLCLHALGWHDTYKIRYLLFLAELFEIVRERFKEFEWKATPSLAAQWHEFISKGTRAEIYGRVTTKATSKFVDFSSKHPPAGSFEDEHFHATFDATQEMLNTTKDRAKGAASALVAAIEAKCGEIDGNQLKDGDVRLLLYFDEAHSLHNLTLTHWKMAEDTTAKSEERSGYYALCSALNELSPSPIFTLYLSTSSALAKFAPPKQHWSSARAPEVPWDLNPPFTELPFDIYEEVEGLVKENDVTMSQVCSLAFMVRFGRPLFRTLTDSGANLQTIIDLAKEKLLCGKEVSDTGLLAAISTRLLFDFEPRREEAMQMESTLVQSHMRVVYSVPSHRLYMRTGSPSEPVLAEAAAQIMNGYGKHSSTKRSDVLSRVAEWTDKGLFETGELGELVARMLLTFAHDLAIEKHHLDDPSQSPYSTPITVIEFINALFQQQWADEILASKPQNVYDGKTFAEAFDGAYINFTHFGRTHSDDVLTDEAAFAAWCRSMGWCFHKTQEGVDLGLPIFLAKLSKLLNRRVMAMLLLQIKNTIRGKRPHVDMDSRTYSFFSPYKDGDVDTRPYVVLVMNLGMQPAYSHGSKATTQKASVSKPHTGASSVQREESFFAATQTTPSKVQASKGKRRETRRRNQVIHPRYYINAFGCSSTVYRVMNEEAKTTYAKILNSREMFAEHPRQEPEFLEQVLSQKPYFASGPASFGWVVPNDLDDPSLSGRNSHKNEASPGDGDRVVCEEATEEMEE